LRDSETRKDEERAQADIDLKDRERNGSIEQQVGVRDPGERDEEIGQHRDEHDPAIARGAACRVDIGQQRGVPRVDVAHHLAGADMAHA